MIYQLVNKRTEILAIATSHINHLCNYYGIMIFCTANFMPRINSIDFYQNRPKIVIFAKKIKIFESWGSAPTPYASGGWGPCPRPQLPPVVGGSAPRPPQRPPIANFWLRACSKKNLLHVTAGIHLY